MKQGLHVKHSYLQAHCRAVDRLSAMKIGRLTNAERMPVTINSTLLEMPGRIPSMLSNVKALTSMTADAAKDK